jgi:hypothetical protein
MTGATVVCTNRAEREMVDRKENQQSHSRTRARGLDRERIFGISGSHTGALQTSFWAKAIPTETNTRVFLLGQGSKGSRHIEALLRAPGLA